MAAVPRKARKCWRGLSQTLRAEGRGREEEVRTEAVKEPVAWALRRARETLCSVAPEKEGVGRKRRIEASGHGKCDWLG